MSALLTASRMKTARACKREHHLKYDLGYRPVADAQELRFGTLVHAGLERWLLASREGLPQDEWLEQALAALEGESDPFDLVAAEEMLRGYHLRWADEPLTVLAVETQFRTALRNPQSGRASQTWELGGKVDGVVRDVSGRVLVIEHKTSSEDVTPGSDYWRRLRMDGQVTAYFEGATALGYDVEGCLYDVLCKPSIRPGNVPLTDDDGVEIVLDANGERVRRKDNKGWRRTGDKDAGFVLQTRPELPEEYRLRVATWIAKEPNARFARGEVPRLESEMAEGLHDMWSLGRELREGELAGRYPRNPDACVRYGRTCPFFDVCTGVADINDPTRFTRNENVHPELAQEASTA